MIPKYNVDLKPIFDKRFDGWDIVGVSSNDSENVASFCITVGVSGHLCHDPGVDLLLFVGSVPILCNNLKACTLSDLPNRIILWRFRSEEHRASSFCSISPSNELIQVSETHAIACINYTVFHCIINIKRHALSNGANSLTLNKYVGVVDIDPISHD